MKNLTATIAFCLSFYCSHSAHAAPTTIMYEYDDLNRLTVVDYGSGTQTTFTYDEIGNPITVTTQGNRPPIANNQTVLGDEDTPFSGILVASDPENDTLTYSIVTEGAKGSVIITDQQTGAFTYTPNPDSNGDDTFTFTVDDGATDSNIATVTLSIAPVNDPPTAHNSQLTTQENTTILGQLTATDPDNSALTYLIVRNGAKGLATITDSATGAFTFTPAPNAHGVDTFTFKANDGAADSNIGTITIPITSVNSPPIAQNSQLTTQENTTAFGQLTATDPENGQLLYALVSDGTKGSATITDSAAGTFTYTPTPDTYGVDTFTFTANDGAIDSIIATVTVTITPSAESPQYGSVVDAPHNSSNNIRCDGCHSYSLWWQYSPLTTGSPLHIEVTEAICLTCHGPNGSSIEGCTHSSITMGSHHNPDTGNWSSTCTDCHDPHLQTQLNWRYTDANELYLATGIIGDLASFESNGSATTFAYTNAVADPAWPAARWGKKNNTTPNRGLILIVDTGEAANSYEVIAADDVTVTVKGRLEPTRAAGQTFGLIYGQMIKSEISAPNGLGMHNVKFFNPDDSHTGYVDTVEPIESLCQVCHSLTDYWTADGQNIGHETLSKCTSCHEPTLGFRPVP